MSTSDLPKSIQTALAMIENERATILKLTEVARTAHEVAEIFKGWNVMTLTFYMPYVLMQRECDSFDEVVPVLRELARRGWHTDKDNPFDDSHETNCRTYNLANPDSKTVHQPLRVRVSVGESSTCRRVQVGTRLEPVYEFICGETPAAQGT